MRATSEEFLSYYLEELSYLRHAGERFARTYPKVAGRLELQRDECPDPHVERLIESFAFLTARIQADLDSDFPEIAAELLNVLYPHYLNPVPSMTVARFEVDPQRGKLTTGHEIPRHTQLFAHAEGGAICRMRTAYPVTLWPVEVKAADVVTPDNFDFLDNASNVASVLRLRLESHADPFDVLEIDKLRFYLHGEPVLVGRLYELLMNHLIRIAVLPAGARAPRDVARDAVVPVGFERDDDIIPYPRYSHPAYRILQEYFAFPEKFHFFDVRRLRGTMSGQRSDLLFLLDQVPSAKMLLTPETFSLGCAPAINLFRKTSEPLRIDHRQPEYRLVADLRREKTTEIHSILSVSGTSDPADPTRDYAPFYSYTHEMQRREQRAFWHARRVAAQHPEMGGTDVLLSFRDLDFSPARPPDEIVYAHLLCSNRALALEMPAGAVMQTDVAAPLVRIVLLRKPTRPADPPLGGQALWRLVSHLSLNYLALGETEDALKALREILRLYCPDDVPALRQQIEGIRRLSHRKVVRRMGSGEAAWKGFCRGTELELVFDESAFVGGSAYLLASVLNQFLGLFASTNSFTQLLIRRSTRESEVWKRWRPMVGAKAVL
jgi:type VI secretion system protein ImpG